MRIAVDCRFLSVGPALLTRGIPRFILQQLRAVVREAPGHEYLLLYRSVDPIEPLGDIRQRPNVTLHEFPGETSRVSMPGRTLRATEDFERWLLEHRVDLFHATAPWLPVVSVFPRIDACPVVTTVYDLIPSLFPEHLIGEMKEGWGTALEGIHRSTRLLAISRFTARDLALHFGIPAERIDVTYPFAGPSFQPLAPEVVASRLSDLRRKRALPDGFVMTVSFPGFRNKNIETLLDGYQRLPGSLRAAMPLVVVGVQGPAADTMRAVCARNGITNDVIVTGVVSDDEMAALYCAARMMVCPSRYEGFGLPIVEAMQCGTPVVTTTAASMPEVAGGAAWLVDAEDPRAFAAAMETLASDEPRRAAMRRAGIEQAGRFTSAALGRATADAYERTVREGQESRARGVASRARVALALRNPVQVDPDVRAALEIADALACGAEVDLFATGDGLPPPDLFRRFRVHDIAALERVHGARPYDAVVRIDEPANAVHAVLPGVADPLGPQPLLQRQQARAQLGLPATSFVVAWPQRGGETVDRQTVLRAFAELCRMSPHARLVVAADPATQTLPADVASLAAGLGVSELVRAEVVPQLEPGAPSTLAAASADAHLVAADVVIALDGPNNIATRRDALRACAAAKPVIVSEGDGSSWLPDDVAIRAPKGPSAALVLGQMLLALSRDPVRRTALGHAARAFYERNFTIEQFGERLRDALQLKPAQVAIDAPRAAEPRRGGEAPSLGFNRVCNLEDFRDPELVAEMREVMAYKHRHYGETFPEGVEDCKDWEVAMATRTLRHFGAIRRDASILGVAAGMEDTLFYLTKHVREVVSVDRYAQAGVWQQNAPFWMMAMPEWGALDGCEPERLVVQHMDARRLRFPDDRFDGIFSSGSIEHFGGLADVAHAAYEMGRVLKPGGVLSLSTVMTVAGPLTHMGVAGTCLLLQPDQISKYIVEASGLELVDTFVTEATPATLGVHRPLEAALNSRTNGAAAHGLKGLQEDYKHRSFPCITFDWGGVTFDSVHLALRKGRGASRVANAWARPTPAVEQAIIDDYTRMVEDYDAWAPPIFMPPVALDRAVLSARQRGRIASKAARHVSASLVSEVDGLRSEVDRLAETAMRADADSRNATWLPVHVAQPAVPPFVIFVDRSDQRDIIANCYMQGLGHVVNAAEVTVMRAFLRQGDTVIDAGAHIGSITLPLAALGCRVLAVEASARNAAMLRASAAYNGFRDVTVVHAAVAAAEGSLGFLSDGAWGWVTSPGEMANEYVPAVPLDGLVQGLGWDRVTLLKIDIEGSELAAIAGATHLLSRPDAPIVYYESNRHTHDHARTRVEQVVAALEAHGYRNYALTPGRFTRVYPDDVQRELVRDHLAIKGAFPRLTGITVDERRRKD